MKTKWKLIYEASENMIIDDVNYEFTYRCYYENYFGVLYRNIYTRKGSMFSGTTKTTSEFLETIDTKFHAIEKAIEYWQNEQSNYITHAVEQFKSK